MDLIKTIKDQCHECYACVRNCPAKAVRVREGQAEVITERCINCANCVRICSQGAKEVKNYIDQVEEILQEDVKVVAGIAPSFPAYNSDLTLEDWEDYLRKIGFDAVYEVAWGAQLMIEEYKNYLNQNKGLVISTACPVIVNYVEKYYPRLVPNLASIVSPMGALVRYISKVENIDTGIVLIGPCHAKKGEFDSVEKVEGVLTYNETADLGQKLGIDLKADKIEKGEKNNDCKQSENNCNLTAEESRQNLEQRSSLRQEPEGYARKIPLAGGLLEGLCENDIPEDYIKVEGSERISELFDSIIKGEINPRFIDALFCEGCINGVDLLEESHFKKENAVTRFINQSNSTRDPGVEYSEQYLAELDLTTSFEKAYQGLPDPDEEEIWSILNKTNKYTEDDLLNCGACGYNSCREKAIAVYQGLAEVEMCLPYLLSEKRSEIEQVQQLNRELDSLINSSYDGMVIVNEDGCIERVNRSYLKMIGVSRKELIGKNVLELEKNRILYPSVSKLSLREKRDITLVQNTDSGKRILVTATPIMSENFDQIERIIVNARDLKELDLAIDNPEENDKLEIYLDEKDEVEWEEGTGHIISHSAEMKGILKLANKIGDTDSTVLITGESGVGKEVVARYIHEQSTERDDFVKINCAAIPGRLLESELFGYETGAFSGARREGKQGLIEQADNGTLFLDEIGEIPLNMQAKLLQVIQEHRVTRIGGVEAINVNFRLITATNRNLQEMVSKKEFREDLFYRLNVVPIKVPPLRQRREDILPLVEYFSNRLGEKYEKMVEFTPEAEQIMFEYDWPGNVRELANILERVIVTLEEDQIKADFIKTFIGSDVNGDRANIVVNDIIPIKEAVARVEKELLAMAKSKGKTTYEMARMLGVNQSTIVRKLNKYFK